MYHFHTKTEYKGLISNFKHQTKDMPKFIVNITDITQNPMDYQGVGCFVVDSSFPAASLQHFAAQAADSLILIKGAQSVEQCLQLGLDGVLLDLSTDDSALKSLQSAQKSLGKNKICGVISRSRRHEAMLLSECEPDFLCFKVWSAGEKGLKELTAWYNELFLIQSAIFVCDEKADFNNYAVDNIILDDKIYKNFCCQK